jgi:hypothetical protein
MIYKMNVKRFLLINEYSLNDPFHGREKCLIQGGRMKGRGKGRGREGEGGRFPGPLPPCLCDIKKRIV